MWYDDSWTGIFADTDGVVFVADSQADRREANEEFFGFLAENVRRHGRDPASFPYVLQLNKRDVPRTQSVEELMRAFGRGEPPFETVASDGVGVVETFRAIVTKVLAEKGHRGEVNWDSLLQGPK